jgi:hypothetical protein
LPHYRYSFVVGYQYQNNFPEGNNRNSPVHLAVAERIGQLLQMHKCCRKKEKMIDLNSIICKDLSHEILPN